MYPKFKISRTCSWLSKLVIGRHFRMSCIFKSIIIELYIHRQTIFSKLNIMIPMYVIVDIIGLCHIVAILWEIYVLWHNFHFKRMLITLSTDFECNVLEQNYLNKYLFSNFRTKASGRAIAHSCHCFLCSCIPYRTYGQLLSKYTIYNTL